MSKSMDSLGGGRWVAVPLSRFTPLVGGGSAFSLGILRTHHIYARFTRHHSAAFWPTFELAFQRVGLLDDFWLGWQLCVWLAFSTPVASLGETEASGRSADFLVFELLGQHRLSDICVAH